MGIEFDLSKLPGDDALVLSQERYTQDPADDLARVMSLDADDRDLIHQEIVGAVAGIVDCYLAGAAEPKTARGVTARGSSSLLSTVRR